MTPAPLPPDFDDWAGLRRLIVDAFAYMDGRIDPPSSVHRLTEGDLQKHAREGWIYALPDLTGCALFTRLPDALYIGKLAVAPAARGTGLGFAFIQAAEALATAENLPRLRLQSRVELIENHAAFARWGFTQTATFTHPGFDRPTSLTFEKPLALA